MLQNANREFIVPSGTSRRSKAQIATEAPLEWRKKAYYNTKVGVYLPSEYIERCIQVAAGKWKLGKTVAATTFCEEPEIPLEVPGVARFTSLDDFETHGWIDRRNVRMAAGQSVGRSRPRVPKGWRATFELVVMSPEIAPDTLSDILDHAGMYVGLGDWRPKFGRFKVIDFKVIDFKEVSA